MSHLGNLISMVNDRFSKRTLPREPEPDLVMSDESQVAAYAEAGRIDGSMAAVYLFHSARISQVIQGCKTVIDLGCGPATQLAQIAELNPSISFHGIDLSATMLRTAEEYIRSKGLTNVRFSQGDISKLVGIADGSADAVISTVALHHLPSQDHLRSCFREISRILRPDGAMYLVDFGRFKSLKTAIYFAYVNRNKKSHLFSLDFERSLRAAFQYEEFEQFAEELLPSNVNVLSTFIAPMFTLLKTADNSLSHELLWRLRTMRKALPSNYRSELDDLRNFFRFGGLKNDPFHQSIFEILLNRNVQANPEFSVVT